MAFDFKNLQPALDKTSADWAFRCSFCKESLAEEICGAIPRYVCIFRVSTKHRCGSSRHCSKMAFDDDENPNALGAFPASTEQGPAAGEGDPEDEMPDYKHFMSMFEKKGVSGKSIRKGEKDFESHGTQLQENTLETSRRAMESVLSYTRVHRGDAWARGWYFPDWAEQRDDTQHPDLRLRERVVVMEHERGNWMKDIGRALPGPKDQPGVGRLWLLPEEALYLVERGSIDLWWPTASLDTLLPPGEGTSESIRRGLGTDDYDVGFPLSLEAAYASLIGFDGESGKISLPKYQVYAHLKRSGFNVLRAPATSSPPQAPPQPPKTLWQWLVSLVSSDTVVRPNQFGPLVVPGLYRAYKPIYQRLAILPRHNPLLLRPESNGPIKPFDVDFYVWKSGGAPFSKKNPPQPDFRIAVVDADETGVPTLSEIEALLESTPYDPPNASWQGPGRLYQRLKHGHRNVLIAIVDRGLVNFMRFAEGAFGEEKLFERFDNRGGPRPGKKGGRGGGRGRGRGRGRGGRGGRGG